MSKQDMLRLPFFGDWLYSVYNLSYEADQVPIPRQTISNQPAWPCPGHCGCRADNQSGSFWRQPDT